MLGLCLLLIALQVADAVSTYLALGTGQAEEKNQLLVSVAATFDLPIMQVIVAAKLVVAAFFAMAITRTRPTPVILGILTALVFYCSYVVAMNFYWFRILS